MPRLPRGQTGAIVVQQLPHSECGYLAGHPANGGTGRPPLKSRFAVNIAPQASTVPSPRIALYMVCHRGISRPGEVARRPGMSHRHLKEGLPSRE